jgi:UDP-GlcNAc:undecaprenyl-phosphate/decaprenyl-phosphate GlcNAc-1-phosphate transferase
MLVVLAAFLLAAVVTWLATPVAIAVARRTGFMDRPVGYKGHRSPTPYLGGSAVMAGVLVASLSFGGATDATAVIVACAVGLWVLGTIDDRRNLSPYLRLAVEVAVGGLLFATGHGWGVFDNSALDLALTCVWVVGVVNAVNLMDNMDGAAATVTAVSAAGAGALAALSSDVTLAALCFSVSGACVGFLPRNLARPSRIFMGDGGSMPLGLLLAGVCMAAASGASPGASSLAAAALIVGLVILDTTLVTVSRRRGGRPLLTGGRDHLTHRLRSRFRSPQAVAGLLATAQLGLCAVVVILTQGSSPAALELSAVLLVIGGAVAIWHLESPPWFDQPAAAEIVFDTLGPVEAAAPAGPG